MTNIKKAVLATVTLSLLITGCGEDDIKDVNNGVIQPEIRVIPDPVVPTPDPYKSAGWYAKIEVSATDTDGKVYNHKTAGVFGELVQSQDTKDQHDIPGYGSAIFQVVFPQTEWADDNGDYFSNYQHFDENSEQKRVWTFQIKNQQTVDLSNAPITINLAGVYDVEYRDDRGSVEYKESKDVNNTKRQTLNLVDVDNTTSYTIDELATANLTMGDKHTRTFRWVLGSVDSTDYEPLPTPQRSAARTATSDFQAAPAKKSGGKFGLPPQ